MHIHGVHIVIVGPGAVNNFHAKVINPGLPRNGSAERRARLNNEHGVNLVVPFSAVSAMELWRGYDGAGGCWPEDCNAMGGHTRRRFTPWWRRCLL